ncbi:MAG: hypothetical protein COA67_05785 [Lutibacter sp.]|nr:MAG: hypothetical protein COA67_05785 [Lutibacter sp.]
MKKTTLFLTFLLVIIYSNKSYSQLDFNLVDIKNNKTIAFNDIFETYDIDKNLPTMLITWSGNWCAPCVRLINRYNDCDLSMMNIITVNVDSENTVESVLDEGYHLKWNKMFNFHANIGSDKKGFDNIFNVSSAPLILYFDKENVSDALISYGLDPYKLIQNGRIDDIKFIWNSSIDLNELAWEAYGYEEDLVEIEKAKGWVLRSIELDKNYSNVDTYASILFKLGDYTKALKQAKQAIEIAKENEQDYEATTELINKIIEKL